MSDIDKKEYKIWLKDIKSKIQSSQIKAAIAVNSALIEFYWDLGKMIVEKQKESNWGNKLLDKLSLDLKSEFIDMKGFSRTNLYYTMQFYKYFNSFNIDNQIVPQLGGQLQVIEIPDILKKIPWGHLKILISKVKDNKECFFYMQETILNNWSRDVLALQIKSNLYERQGKAITNFYLSAVDSYVKDDNDKPTIGMLLCRDKNNIEAEFSLRDINKPIGISEFEFTEMLPDDIKSSLPTIEELEKLEELELGELNE